MATAEQKQKALKEFKLGEKSKFWNSETKRINARNFGATIGVSDYTVNEWYARWQFNPNTDLSPLKTGKGNGYDALREQYFEMLGEGLDPIYREVAAEIGATCSQIKRWRKEYIKNGGILKEKVVGRKTGQKVASKIVAKPEVKSVQNAVKNFTKTPAKPAAKIEPPKSIQVLVEEKSDVEKLDSFFDGLSKMQEENKSLKAENSALKTENTLYKTKCQKWAARVVELQNGYALKG